MLNDNIPLKNDNGITTAGSDGQLDHEVSWRDFIPQPTIIEAIEHDVASLKEHAKAKRKDAMLYTLNSLIRKLETIERVLRAS
jgi:hypothetical protein